MTKVEKDVAQLMTDIAVLKRTLVDLKKMQGITMFASQSENGIITLVTKNPDNNFSFKGADGKGSVVSIQKNTPEKDATSILIEGDPNSPYVFTTGVPIPTSVTEIQLVSSLGSGDSNPIKVAQNKLFIVNVYLNTNDGKPVVLTAGNFTVIEPKTRAAESEIEVSPNFTVLEAEQIGTTNEYQLTVKAGSWAEKTPFPYIQLRLNNPAQSVSGKLAIYVINVPDFANVKYFTEDFSTAKEYTTTLDDNEFGSEYVFVVNEKLERKTRKITLEINSVTPGISSSKLMQDLSVTLYEEKAKLTWPAGIVYTMNMSSAENEKLTTDFARFLTENSTTVNVVEGVAKLDVVEGKYVISIDATTVAKTMKDNTIRNYVVVLRGRAFSVDGRYVAVSARLSIGRLKKSED